LNILNQTLPAILATLASVVSISRISSIRPERVGLSLRGRTGTFYWFTGYGVIICPETSLLRPPAIGHAGDVVVHGLVLAAGFYSTIYFKPLDHQFLIMICYCKAPGLLSMKKG